MERRTMLAEVMSRPDGLSGLGATEWDVLIPQARATGLLGRLAAQADALPEQAIPAEVRWHLDAARRTSASHAASLKWELTRIDRILGGFEIPVVLLKGPAYMLKGYPWGRGRICGDIDLMVPQARLADVERELSAHGWEAAHMEPHQDRYFREWMHELPALVHRERGTKIDVHHNILPRIDSIHIDPDRLIANSLPINGYQCLRVLGQDDMLLHSAAHLFRRGLYQNGLRDLLDMNGLLSMYVDEGDWGRLLARADELGLGEPLFLAIRYTTLFLGAPEPNRVRETSCRDSRKDGGSGGPALPLRSQASGRLRDCRPSWPPLWLLDRLVREAVLPPRLDGPNRFRTVCHWVLARYPLCLWKKTIRPKLGRVLSWQGDVRPEA